MVRPVLSTYGIHKKFGGVTAIDNSSFRVDQGTIFGIIGPNGAGKTTLFNILTGFLRPDEGEIRFHDQLVNGLRPDQIVDLGMARTFQIVKPYYEMTVMETLQVSRQCKRIRSRYSDEKEIAAKNHELLVRLSLEDTDHAVVNDLTQGELRLLDIGRALATEPEILFLDEPFSGLGQEASKSLSELLVGLNQEGMTMVIIEHRLRELMKLVSTVMAINFGQVLAMGTPREIVNDEGVIQAYLGTSGGDAIAIED